MPDFILSDRLFQTSNTGRPIDYHLFTWNLDNKGGSAEVKLYKPIIKAWKATHIETAEKELIPLKGKLNLDFKPQQIKTYRIVTKR